MFEPPGGETAAEDPPNGIGESLYKASSVNKKTTNHTSLGLTYIETSQPEGHVGMFVK